MDCTNVHKISQGGAGVKVLLVDKDPNSLMYMSSILEEHSYQVTTTQISSVALGMAVECKFDLIISEIDMPEMDGFELLKQITSKVDTPILLISASEDREMVSKALNGGAWFFYHKPIEPYILVNVWQHFLSCSLEKNKLREGLIPTAKAKSSAVLGKMPLMSTRNESNDIRGSSQLSKRVREDNDDKRTSSVSSSKQKQKTRRLVWTPQRKQKFQEVYEVLGEIRATPSKIKELINEPEMTPQHISSYLQKFRTKMKEEREEATKRGVHNLDLRSQSCLGTYPASLHSTPAPYQSNPRLNISRPSYCNIQAPGNLVHNVRTKYNNIQPHTQMANLSNFISNTSKVVNNRFGLQGNIGSGLQPLGPISATRGVLNHWKDRIEAPNMANFQNNNGVAKFIPRQKPQLVKQLNGGLVMVGNNTGASEGNAAIQAQEQNGGLGTAGNNIRASDRIEVSQVVQKENGGICMTRNNIGASEGNAVSQLQEQNDDLGMKGDNFEDMIQELTTVDEIRNIHYFPDDNAGKDGSSLGGNVSACSLVTGPSTPHIGTASGGERLTETSSNSLFDNDEMNRFLAMFELPANSDDDFIIP